MPYRDPEKRREAIRKSQRKAYLANPEKFRAKAREWAKLHPRPGSHNKKGTPSYTRSLEALREWKGNHPEAPVNYHRRAKQEFIDAMGGICECLGCGNSFFEHLTLDHIHGRENSAEDNKKGRYGQRTYAQARREGYPRDKYRLLCWNCNSSRGIYGFCPHERLNKEPIQPDLPLTNPG